MDGNGIVNMKEYLKKENIIFLESSTKKEALEELIECLVKNASIKDKDAIKEGIFYREKLMSTGIGLGIAVPHIRHESIENITVCVGICRKEINDYESFDGKPVKIIIMIAAGKNQHAQYLRILSYVSSKLKNDELREKIFNANDVDTIYSLMVGG